VEEPVPRAPWIREPEEALRQFALKFPEATEDHPWDHIAVKVKGKTFVFLSGPDDTFNVTCKLPSSGRLALTLPFASPTGYGLGKSGWMTASFKDGDKIPLDRMAEWIEESYRAIASKKLVAVLEGGNVEPVKPITKKASVKKRKQ
jgi:predicted DNA-binding protein (MmcQ/YjbR family)